MEMLNSLGLIIVDNRRYDFVDYSDNEGNVCSYPKLEISNAWQNYITNLITNSEEQMNYF